LPKRPRCARCGRSASYTPSWAPKLSLCEEHFIEAFRKRVEKALDKGLRRVEIRRVLVGVSGGKDSVALLDVLAWYSSRRGFEVIGAYIDLGIPGYSKHSMRVAVDAFNTIGVDYVVVEAREVLGVDTRLAHEAFTERVVSRPTCSVCGMIKRRILETLAKNLGADAIATGHTFDDVFSFTLQNLASGYRETFAVVERGSGLMRLKPLLVVRESDTLAYVEARRLPFTETPCPYKPSRSVTAWYKYVGGLLGSLNPGLASSLAGIRYEARKAEVRGRCVYCGSVTAERVCSTCRTVSQILRWLVENQGYHSTAGERH